MHHKNIKILIRSYFMWSEQYLFVCWHWWWHFLPTGTVTSLKGWWQKCHLVSSWRMIWCQSFKVECSQHNTSWSPWPERALSSRVVIGWVADAMISSILNSDFISTRLIVQGRSLEEGRNDKLSVSGRKLRSTEDHSCKRKKGRLLLDLFGA